MNNERFNYDVIFFGISIRNAMGDLRSVSLFSRISILFFALASIGSSSGLNQTVIVVSFDGLGWEFVGSKRANTPNFDFFANGGVKAKNLLGVHPVKTFPTHATFLTGLYPESHGIVDNKFWDPLYIEKFILEHDCSNFDPKFYNESEPIWLTMQKQGMRTGAFYWPGSTSYSEKPTFHAEPFCYLKCDDYKGPMLEYLRLYLKIHCFFNWAKSFHKRIDTVLEWLTSEDPPQLVLLYFEQPDVAGHKNGPNAETYVKKIEEVDREVVGYLVERLMRYQLMDKTNVILLSDHGIIETSDRRQIRIFDYVDPESYFGNIAAQEHIWPKPGKLEEIYAKLKDAKNPHLQVYKKEDIPEELHWKYNRRIPPLYLVAEEGWLMRQDYNPLAEGKWVEGTHGWPPTEKSAGIFYARGPAFKEGYTSNKSKRAIDVYALLSYLVGVTPLPHNGSLENMREFLKETSAPPQRKKIPGTSITSHTVLTPTITNQTIVSAQTTTEYNQCSTKGNQTQQDSTNCHADILTKTTASTLPLNQTTTDKEQRPRYGSFVHQHTEVHGNTLDHRSRSCPQTTIKDAPTATLATKQRQQTYVLPQTETNPAMGVITSTASSLGANTSLTQDSVKGKATGVNEKRSEKTTRRSLHAHVQTPVKKQKGILSSNRILPSEISSRSSDLNQTYLVRTSSLLTLDSKPPSRVIMTKTFAALTDSKHSKTTPVLMHTPTLNSILQPLITTSVERHSNPSPAAEEYSFNSTETETNSPQIASPSAFLSSINADPGFSTTTLRKMTESSLVLRASAVPKDGNRAHSKMLIEGNELDLGTTTPVSFILATPTQNSEIAQASIDVSYQNTETKTSKELLVKTTDSDAVEGITTSLQHQQHMTNSAVPTHNTENKLSETVLRTKTPGVLVVLFKQVPTIIASSSSVITPTTTNINFTRNNNSTTAPHNSTMSNDTKSSKTDGDDFNIEAMIDCPPGYEEEVDSGEQMDEYSGNSNAKSSATSTTKQFSYLESVIVLIIVKLNAWLCA